MRTEKPYRPSQRRLTEREEELLPVLALCVARYQADESKLKGAHPHD